MTECTPVLRWSGRTQLLILLDNQHEAWDCSFFKGSCNHSSDTGPSSLGIFHCKWEMLMTVADKGRQPQCRQPSSRELTPSPLIKIFLSPQLWIFRNLYALTPSLCINSLRHHQHCSLAAESEEHLPSRCFIYYFEKGSIFQDNLFYFGMKVSIFINFV